jgi:Acetyltransferase (GNAT) domain
MEQQGSGDPFTIQTIRDLSEIESVGEVWRTWERTRDTSLDFYSGRIGTRGSACRPHILVLLRNGKPEALLVGLRDRKKIPIKIRSVTIFQPEVTILEFLAGGLLGNASEQNCQALVQAVLRSLAEGEADLALWEQLDVESALYSSVKQTPGIPLRDHCHKLSDHWYERFPYDLEAFFLSLRQTQRSKLRRKYKKFLDAFAGKIEVRCFRTTSEVGQAIEEMEGIARKSVKRHLGFGFFYTPQAREQLLVEAAQGWLRVFVLYIDGMPVSFWKGTLYKHCLQADYVGFDAAWSEFSPGIFLFLKVIESFRDSDVETVDFGTGNGQFYESFAKLRRPVARVRMFAPGFRGSQLNLLHAVAHHATLLIEGTYSFGWPRKTIWKVRKPTLERISPKLSKSDLGKPHSPFSARLPARGGEDRPSISPN